MLRFHGSGMNTGRLPSHMRDGSLPAPGLSIMAACLQNQELRRLPTTRSARLVQWFLLASRPLRGDRRATEKAFPFRGRCPEGAEEVESVLYRSLFQSLPVESTSDRKSLPLQGKVPRRGGRGRTCTLSLAAPKASPPQWGGGPLAVVGVLPVTAACLRNQELHRLPTTRSARLVQWFLPASRPLRGGGTTGDLFRPLRGHLPQRGRQGTTSNGQQTFPKEKRLWDLHVENLGYDSARGLAPGASVNSYTI